MTIQSRVTTSRASSASKLRRQGLSPLPQQQRLQPELSKHREKPRWHPRRNGDRWRSGCAETGSAIEFTVFEIFFGIFRFYKPREHPKVTSKVRAFLTRENFLCD